MLDYKITKKHYPRTNSNSVLEFIFEKDPNLFLQKNKILIRGSIEIDDKFTVENGWVSKLFTMLTVEVDSQTVSTNKSRQNLIYILSNNEYLSPEYFLADYMLKLGNYNTDYITSVFVSEGYNDYNNCNADNLASEEGKRVIQIRERTAIKANGKARYDFAFIPDAGFLGNADPLFENCELKLRFDRAEPMVALLKNGEGGLCPEIQIKDCYAVTEYISSPDLRNYFDQIEYEPLLYKFEDVEVLVKSIPYNQTRIRFDNLRGGNTPTHIFAGIIKTDALDGDFELCSSQFNCNGVEEMNFTLNGNSVNGYPLSIKDGSSVFPLQKFIDSTMRTSNVNCGKFLTPNEYRFNWIWAHHFEAEQTSQGWAGINFKLSKAFSETDGSMSLVVWIISPAALKIDKFHQINKVNL